MKKSTILSKLTFVFISTLLSSCQAIGGIFKTGMGVGVILTILIIIGILVFVFRGKKKQERPGIFSEMMVINL